MMHYFVYQADRHNNARYRYQRLSTTTIRNDFNLETMRNGLKGRYTIHGYTTHPFHKILKDMNLQDLMKGHIIEVPEAKHAIWLKLNYDQIGKGKTTFLASYRDIQTEDLEPLKDEYLKLQGELSAIQSDTYAISSFANNISYFINRQGRDGFSSIGEDVLASSQILYDETIKEKVRVSLKLNEAREKVETIIQKVKDYLKSHEM